ncbi:hypothetical protein B0H19DRAFT_1265613 [Mycena capillaripes]|nr:hypothetical protein B0H19DRAFT_1265613 [Mycena capillaripes]
MSQTTDLSPGFSVTWADQALITAAGEWYALHFNLDDLSEIIVIYIYDFIVTFTAEVKLYKRNRGRAIILIFTPLRYFALLYQITVIPGIVAVQFRPQRFSLLKISVGLIMIPQCFQFVYVVLLLSCLRATFDALATIALLMKLRNMLKDRTGLSSLIKELFREEIYDIIIIFGIMALEAVFVQLQMSSVRAHARNYIAPFVDSLTAILATRFILGSLTRGQRQDVDNISVGTPRISFDLRSPASTIVENHVGDSQSSLDESRSVIFPAWPPEVGILTHDKPANL